MKHFPYEGNMKFRARKPEAHTWWPGAIGADSHFRLQFCVDVFSSRNARTGSSSRSHARSRSARRPRPAWSAAGRATASPVPPPRGGKPQIRGRGLPIGHHADDIAPLPQPMRQDMTEVLIVFRDQHPRGAPKLPANRIPRARVTNSPRARDKLTASHRRGHSVAARVAGPAAAGCARRRRACCVTLPSW